MASLWARVSKARQLYSFDLDPAICNGFVHKVGRRKWPVLVNIQSIFDQMVGREVPVGNPSHDIVPCRAEMWLEFMPRTDLHVGSWISRIARRDLSGSSVINNFPPPEPAQFLIECTQIVEHEESAAIAGQVRAYADQDGRPLLIQESSCSNWGLTALRSTFALASEALTTMNTLGTRIEPPFDKPPAQVVKPKRAPCSVWHTIHLPHFAQAPLNAETSDEMLERREHWVRAHRRDYRHGGGMFGRVKALVWVPEFKRGNAELGTVRQSYAVMNFTNTKKES
jgi:hypothetical protein